MFTRTIVLAFVVSISACTTHIERRQANDVEKYSIHKNAHVTQDLVIPEGLSEPNYSNEYEIPALDKNADVTRIGEQLDIRPPLQVLPMASGTRVEEKSEHIKVVVEAIDDEIDLQQELFDVVTGFLQKKSIVVTRSDVSGGVIETDWIENTEELESNLWGADKEYTLKQKYRFDIDVSPHGRSGSLAISLIDHQEFFDTEIRDIVLNGEDKKRYTIDMLNSAIQYIGVKRKEILKKKQVKEALGIDVELANTEATQYWLAAAKYRVVWQRLRVVLPELGFSIADLDQSHGLFHVEVNDDGGFWSSLWEDKPLPLKEGRYRVEIERGANNSTEIYLKDDDTELLDNQLVEQIYPKFAELMKIDRNK